jgi:large subunit ribosomal protein L25
MSEVVVHAEIRNNTGKHAKHTLANGMVPGVYYARGEQNINLQVPVVTLNQVVFTSETHIIDLHLADGSSHKCILKDVQFDPVTDRPVHFDLQGLKENEKLSIEIPVSLVGGIPKGVRDGGMLQHFLHKVRVLCLPKDIPEKIEINVAELGINNFVHVRDLNVPNVTLVEAADNAIVGVMPPHVVKEEEVAPAVVEEAAKEPEVVGKGKKTEEGAEGAAPAEKGEKKSEKPEKAEKGEKKSEKPEKKGEK